MKLSIIILCWNDMKVIGPCLQSIYSTTHSTDFEVIVSDNGSTDGSIEYIRREFPKVRLLENGTNLRFAKGNNVAIRVSQGEYVLILNPDTIIHEGTLDGMLQFADEYPQSGAFGCRVLNTDGTYQACIRPMHTVRSEWCQALCLGWLAHLSDWFNPGAYVNWHGETQRTVGWPAGCFILARGELLRRLGGFDEQFFYYYEDTDLCRRIWESGSSILYTPNFTITHLGGQSTVNRFNPVTFALDGEITRYRYHYKYSGATGVRLCRWATLVGLMLRRIGYSVPQLIRPSETRKKRLQLLKTLFEWNYRVHPIRLVKDGEEPELTAKPTYRVLER
jgi:GT2 family glycosyltransferase